MAEDKLFYVCQKALIQNDKNEILTLTTEKGTLDFPGGKIQKGESNFEEALKREVLEEIGIQIQVGVPFYIWTNDWKTKNADYGDIVVIGRRCTYTSGNIRLISAFTHHQWVNKNNFYKVNDGKNCFIALEKYFSG